jgi:hypothetical protein
MTTAAKRTGLLELDRSPHARLTPLALDDAAITDGLWADREQINRQVLLPEVSAEP